MYIFLRLSDNTSRSYRCISVRYFGKDLVIELDDDFISFPISDILGMVCADREIT